MRGEQEEMGPTFKGDASLTAGEEERELSRESLRLLCDSEKVLTRPTGLPFPNPHCSLDKSCLGQKQPGSRTPPCSVMDFGQPQMGTLHWTYSWGSWRRSANYTPLKWDPSVTLSQP